MPGSLNWEPGSFFAGQKDIGLMAQIGLIRIRNSQASVLCRFGWILDQEREELPAEQAAFAVAATGGAMPASVKDDLQVQAIP